MKSLGISSIIASILMIIIVAALGGTTYFFVAGSLGGSTSQSFIISDSYNDTVTISNTGTDPINSLTVRLDNNPVEVAIVPNIGGLVGYWSFNENVGTVSMDCSNNHNNLNVGSGSWVAGKFDTAIQRSAALSNTLSNPGTIEIKSIAVWAKIPTSSIDPYGTIVGGDNRALGDTLEFNLCGLDNGVGNGIAFFSYYSGAQHSEVFPGAYADGSWHLIVVTQDSSGLKIYVDDQGPVVDAAINGVMTDIDTITINGGASRGCSGAEFMTIDELQFYNRVLTQAEVNRLYSGLIPPGESGTIRFITSFDSGKHNIRICTPSMCTRGVLTII